MPEIIRQAGNFYLICAGKNLCARIYRREPYSLSLRLPTQEEMLARSTESSRLQFQMQPWSCQEGRKLPPSPFRQGADSDPANCRLPGGQGGIGSHEGSNFLNAIILIKRRLQARRIISGALSVLSGTEGIEALSCLKNKFQTPVVAVEVVAKGILTRQCHLAQAIGESALSSPSSWLITFH